MTKERVVVTPAVIIVSMFKFPAVHAVCWGRLRTSGMSPWLYVDTEPLLNDGPEFLEPMTSTITMSEHRILVKDGNATINSHMTSTITSSANTNKS